MNWVQRIVVKAIGLSPGAKPSRFQEVVMNTFGINALWNSDSFEDNVRAYSSNVILYSIITRITNMASVAPFKVYKVKDKKKHMQYKSWTGSTATSESIKKAMTIKALVYEEDNSHPLNALIEKPNDNQKGNEFTRNAIAFKLLTGNRFLYTPILDAGADRGKPYEVVVLPSHLMVIIPDGGLHGVKEYKFSLSRKEEPITVDEIIHSRYFNPDWQADGSHLWGLSPVKACSKNLTRSEAALSRSTATLQNAGAAGALIDKSGTDDSIEQASETRDRINRRVNGSDRSGAISLLNGEWDYINFGMTTADMQVLEVEKISDRKLCNAYSFPPGVFDPDSATLNNSKEFNKQIITGAVIPELSSLRDDWNEIAKMYNEDIYVDYDLSVYPELQEDLEKLASALEKIWYLKGNEKRLMIGQDEDSDEPMMNTYLVPSGLTPIGQLGDNYDALLNELDNDA